MNHQKAIETKDEYSIFQNNEGIVSITINAMEGDPEGQRFIYDGSSALLFRGFGGGNLHVKDISKEAAQALDEIDKVTILELLDDKIIREYVAPVRRVKNVGALMYE